MYFKERNNSYLQFILERRESVNSEVTFIPNKQRKTQNRALLKVTSICRFSQSDTFELRTHLKMTPVQFCCFIPTEAVLVPVVSL